MRFVWVIFGFLLLLSCQDIEEVERPNDLIPESQMVEILTDLSLLNSAKNYNKRLLEESGLRPDEYLYSKHNIDSARLAQSTRYYASNSTQIENIYKRVQDNLNRMRVELEKIQAEEIRIKDSIQALQPQDSLRRDITADSLRRDTTAIKPVPDSLAIMEYRQFPAEEN